MIYFVFETFTIFNNKVKPWFYSFLSGSGKLIVVTSYFVILGQIQIQAGDLAPGAVHTFLANV